MTFKAKKPFFKSKKYITSSFWQLYNRIHCFTTKKKKKMDVPDQKPPGSLLVKYHDKNFIR